MSPSTSAYQRLYQATQKDGALLNSTAAQQLEIEFMRVFAEIEEARALAPAHDDLLPIWFYSISADIGLRSITQVRRGFVEESQRRRARADASPGDIYADIADTFDRKDPLFLPVLDICLSKSLIDLALTTQSWERNYQEGTTGLHFIAWDWAPAGPGKLLNFRCLEEPNPAEFDGRFLFILTTEIAMLELEKNPSKAPAFIR
jgi:hypothetical protein